MKKIIFFVGVAVLAIFALMALAYSVVQSDPKKDTDATITDDRNDYVIEKITIDDELQTPDPQRGVRVASDIPQDAALLFSARVLELGEKIERDPTLLGQWLELAVLYHGAGDFEGAREVWEFLIQALPGNTIAYDNLGKLYHFQLKEFPKSESYFLQSIAVDPKAINPYLGLYELYRYSYKTETTLAADTLKQAIAVFPDEFGLYVTLGSYYRDVGNFEQSRAVLLEGLDKARDAGNVDAMASLGNALNTLPQ